MQINDYGKLCTMMYEQLHPTADPQELAFYLSYAKPGEQMLELLCGSGRFLIPFWKKGLSIDGVDLSAQMLEQLEQKLPRQSLPCTAAARTHIRPKNAMIIFLSPATPSRCLPTRSWLNGC